MLPTSLPIHRSRLLGLAAGRCSLCPPPLPTPARGRGPSPGASWGRMDCYWVEGPTSCVPRSDSSGCTQRVEVSLHLLLFIPPSRGWQSLQKQSVRDEGNQPLRLGSVLFFEAHLLLSSYNFGLWLYSAGSMILLPLNFPVECWDGRFVWNPKFSFRFSHLGRLAFSLRVVSGGKYVGQTGL